MGILAAVAIAGLGVLVAETLEALRLFLRGDGPGRTHRWPGDLRPGGYVTVAAIRLVLAALVVLSLSAVGALCNETLAFLAGLSTLKVIEILFGYTPAAQG